MTTLVPGYLDIDYNTYIQKIKEQLQVDPVFADYNYEGSNIAILIELMAYLADINTFLLNKLAKNIYIDTADTYETVHMLSHLRGYNPSGYRSASTTVTVSIGASAGVSIGDTILVSPWKTITCPDATDTAGNVIKFSTTAEYTETIPLSASFPYTISLYARQGDVTEYTYTGDDIINYKLFLPNENFDYDNDLDDQSPSIQVQIGDDIWDRISDFYDNLSGLYTEDDVFMFKYDKYEKYLIEFSSLRNYPASTEDITVTVLKSLGAAGTVGADNITLPETNFLYNQTTSAWSSNDYLTVTNTDATVSSADPETITEIVNASTGVMHSQYRNVTAKDYISHLESRSDVDVANVWGEQEVAPSGSVTDYNKVYVSVIPNEWGTSTIETSAASAGIEEPYEWSETYQDLLSVYLEPRKMLSAYEAYELPELIYFKIDMGIKIKRTYTFANVSNDVKNKLTYFFSTTNRSFNETISFIDIIEFITDTTIESTTDDFDQIKGIQTLIIRNIDVLNATVYEPNTIGNDPQFTVASSTYTGENKLRKITLGSNQYPAISIDDCVFTEET